jgi:hypothetical protein
LYPVCTYGIIHDRAVRDAVRDRVSDGTCVLVCVTVCESRVPVGVRVGVSDREKVIVGRCVRVRDGARVRVCESLGVAFVRDGLCVTVWLREWVR